MCSSSKNITTYCGSSTLEPYMKNQWCNRLLKFQSRVVELDIIHLIVSGFDSITSCSYKVIILITSSRVHVTFTSIQNNISVLDLPSTYLGVLATSTIIQNNISVLDLLATSLGGLATSSNILNNISVMNV